MALPIHRNPISLGQIREEFSGPGGQISLNDYHAGWGIVSPGTIGYPFWQATPIPSSGQISLGNFHGATRQQIFKITYSQTWVSPITGNISMILVAGGGAGGCGGGDEGGGGAGAGGVLYVQNIWVQQGQAYWIHIGRGASVPVDHRYAVNSTIRSILPPGRGPAYDGYCIDHAEHSVAFGYTAQRGGNGGFWSIATHSRFFQPTGGPMSSVGDYVNRNMYGHNHFDLLPEKHYSNNILGTEVSFVLGTVNFTGPSPYYRSDWTKSGWVGGSGGGGNGRNGRADGSLGVVGQGNAGAAGGEEGDSGGGGGAGSGGYGGNRGGGEGRTFYIGNEVLTVGGGGACGPGWWNADYIPGGSGGGGGKSKWAISENGAPNTGGGGAGGSAGNWADAGPFKGGGGGGSGLCWIMIGY